MEQIRAAHKPLARLYHPDKCSEPHCPARYMAIQRAYEALKGHHSTFWEQQRMKEEQAGVRTGADPRRRGSK